MRDDAPAQIVQHLRRHGAPVFAWRVLAHAPIGPGQFAREFAEGQLVERPGIDHRCEFIQRHNEPRAHRLGRRWRLRRPCAARRAGRGSRRASGAIARLGLFGDILERFHGGLGVARAGKFPREVACRNAQPPALVAQKRFQQPQQRAPALHRLAIVVHRDRVGFVWPSAARASASTSRATALSASPTGRSG